jgi:hypothetical protein
MTLLDLITALGHVHETLARQQVPVRFFDGDVEYIITTLIGTKDGVLMQLQRKDLVQDVV